MIAPVQQTNTPVNDEVKPPAALPDFPRLARAAIQVNAPIVAVLLLLGKLWLSLSVVIGVALSLATCGFIYLFVSRGMDLYSATASSEHRTNKNGSLPQFLLLLPAKFLVLALIGWALLSSHSVNYFAVLAGFALAQATVVMTAGKHYNKPHGLDKSTKV